MEEKVDFTPPSDHDIEENVHRILKEHPNPEVRKVKFRVRNREVILLAKLVDPRLKNLIHELIQDCPGVRSVSNLIEKGETTYKTGSAEKVSAQASMTADTQSEVAAGADHPPGSSGSRPYFNPDFTKSVHDIKVIQALKNVDRSLFVPEEIRSRAHLDIALPIQEQQTTSQPSLIGVMTQALQLRPESKVLEIGTGSGYQTAILAEIAREVFTVEIRQTLSEKARRVLEGLKYSNVQFKVGDGAKGWKENAPYDGILVTAANTEIPEALISQLTPHGRMIIPLTTHDRQWLYLLQKEGNDYSYTLNQICEVRFVPFAQVL